MGGAEVKPEQVQWGYSDNEYYLNIDLIILIQAHMRGKVQRLRYERRRDESRKMNTRFLRQDLFETVNKRPLVNFCLLFDGNEGELA